MLKQACCEDSTVLTSYGSRKAWKVFQGVLHILYLIYIYSTVAHAGYEWSLALDHFDEEFFEGMMRPKHR